MHFDWDDESLKHLARHGIATNEAEEVTLNRPIDLESHLRDGEERVVQVGETDGGKILIEITSVRAE